MTVQRGHRAVVRFEGIAYEMDLRVLRVALVHRQVQGEFHRKEQLAEAVGCSRSTVSRFLSGRDVSLQIALAVLKALHVRFDEVYRRCADDGSTNQEA